MKESDLIHAKAKRMTKAELRAELARLKAMIMTTPLPHVAVRCTKRRRIMSYELAARP